MKSQILRSWRDIDALSREWTVLHSKSTSPSVFLTWEWIQAWKEVIDSSVEPFVVTVRDDRGTLVGIAPLYLASIRILGIIECRTLRCMADVSTGSEYPDWIIDKDHEAPVAAMLVRELEENASQWDLVWLSCVSGWTGAEKRILDAANKQGLLAHSRGMTFSAFDLPADMQTYEMRFSGRRRQQMRRMFRKIAKLDDVEFVRCETLEQLPEFLDALFELHQMRWEAEGIDGCFRRRPAEARFYRNFARVAQENAWLALFGIRENGRLKAVQFGYMYDGSFLQLQEGYDPNFQNGAGNALRYFVIQECIAMGMKQYDFLAGESEHKRRWAADTRSGFDILLGSGSMKSRLIFLGQIWPTGRFAEQRGLVVD